MVQLFECLHLLKMVFFLGSFGHNGSSKMIATILMKRKSRCRHRRECGVLSTTNKQTNALSNTPGLLLTMSILKLLATEWNRSNKNGVTDHLDL